MVRLDDDLYTRIFETAHDNRVSMNTFITDSMREKVNSDQVRSEQKVRDVRSLILDEADAIPEITFRRLIKMLV